MYNVIFSITVAEMTLFSPYNIEEAFQVQL